MALEPAIQEELVARLMAWGDVEPRRMFGGDAFLVKGRMFAFFDREGVAFKVPSPQREDLLKDSRVSPLMHRWSGRAFGEWLHLRLTDARDVALALRAVEASYHHAQATPKELRKR